MAYVLKQEHNLTNWLKSLNRESAVLKYVMVAELALAIIFIIAGILITLVSAVVASLYMGSPFGILIGLPVAYILSSPYLGTYQLLPSELGIGVIVILFLSAVVIWLLD